MTPIINAANKMQRYIWQRQVELNLQFDAVREYYTKNRWYLIGWLASVSAHG